MNLHEDLISIQALWDFGLDYFLEFPDDCSFVLASEVHCYLENGLYLSCPCNSNSLFWNMNLINNTKGLENKHFFSNLRFFSK